MAEFGDWIRRTFSNPLKEISGEGYEFEIALDSPERIAHVILMEEIAEGERVREYILEAKKNDGQWVELAHGSAIGHKKIDRFEPIVAKQVRLRILEAVAKPLIRKFAVLPLRE